jgi:hypothetical protein
LRATRDRGGRRGRGHGGGSRVARAALVIAGSYYRQGDSLLLEADILDANAGGRLVQTVGPVAALTSAPLAGVETLRQRVVGGLAVLVDSSLGPYASRSMTMPSYDAYREFLQGEHKMRAMLGARTRSSRCCKRDARASLRTRRRIWICYRPAGKQGAPNRPSRRRTRCDARRRAHSSRRT